MSSPFKNQIKSFSFSIPGHFLHARLQETTPVLILKSPEFGNSRENCVLEVFTHQSAMDYGSYKVIIQPTEQDAPPWEVGEVMGNDLRKWHMSVFRIDKVTKDFRVLFEVLPNGLGYQTRGHFSIDNIRMKNCFVEEITSNNCNLTTQVKCKEKQTSVCIKTPKICDIDVDCDESEDELLNCGNFYHIFLSQ